MDAVSIQYPIGKFTAKESYTAEELHEYIQRIETLPARVTAAISGLTNVQLDTPYREGGWTIRQVVHHLPDSHLNAYVRVKWALTEETPTIKAYDEKAWALTPETKGDPILSLNVLTALHQKWVVLLKSLSAQDLQRQFYHPDSKKFIRLCDLLGMYAWHGDHHLGHIKTNETNS